jgi:hypothetical protein
MRGEWSASRPSRSLPPGKGPPVPIVQEAGWAPETFWTQRLEEKSFRLYRGSNLDLPVDQPIARHYTLFMSTPTNNFTGTCINTSCNLHVRMAALHYDVQLGDQELATARNA